MHSLLINRKKKYFKTNKNIRKPKKLSKITVTFSLHDVCSYKILVLFVFCLNVLFLISRTRNVFFNFKKNV